MIFEFDFYQFLKFNFNAVFWLIIWDANNFAHNISDSNR